MPVKYNYKCMNVACNYTVTFTTPANRKCPVCGKPLTLVSRT